MKRLRSQLAAFSITRTILNTGFRLVYPFLPTFARALGVDLETIALAVTARSALGLAGPLLGSAGDHLGRKRSMLIGLGLFAAGMAIVIVSPTYAGLFLALLLSAAGKIVFDPAMQAYLGDRVHYAQRGTAIAATEFGWSGASLLGLPLVGWLISRYGWQSPFPLLAGLGLLALLALGAGLPGDAPTAGGSPSLNQALRAIRAHRPAMAALTITLLISVGNEIVNIVYGAWLEGSFGLKVAALGASAAVIGIAELSGEGLVATMTDRIGKERAIAIGLAAIALTCLWLPVASGTLTGALIAIFLLFISFEFTFVSSLSMITEIAPASRATLMAGNLTAAAAGRALGATLGPYLFRWGIFANGIFGAATALASLWLLLRFIKVE